MRTSEVSKTCGRDTEEQRASPYASGGDERRARQCDDEYDGPYDQGTAGWAIPGETDAVVEPKQERSDRDCD